MLNQPDSCGMCVVSPVLPVPLVWGPIRRHGQILAESHVRGQDARRHGKQIEHRHILAAQTLPAMHTRAPRLVLKRRKVCRVQILCHLQR